jgi:hypothetical protein
MFGLVFRLCWFLFRRSEVGRAKVRACLLYLQPFASGLGGSELMRLPRLSDSPRSSGDIPFIIESPLTLLGTACIFALVSVKDHDNRFF